MIKVKLSAKTEGLLSALVDMASEPMARCGAVLALKVRESSVRSFDAANKGDPNEDYKRKWKPWAKSTEQRYRAEGIAKRRAKRKGKKKPITHSLLYATGTLAGNIATSFDVVGRDKVRVLAGVTERAEYGVAHQLGTNKAGRGRNVRIPARPFIGLTSRNRDEAVRYYQSEVVSSVTKRR